MPYETKTRGRPRNERIAGMMVEHGCSRATAYRKAKDGDRPTLRQQVTALKQELARLRATAKPQAADVPRGKVTESRKEKGIKPEGLFMEALQAAAAKPSIGVVGVGIDEEAATTEAPRSQLPVWVRRREALRQAIEEALELPALNENIRKAQKRLAGVGDDGGMEDICKKLPEGVAEIIIPLAIWTRGFFPLARRIPQSAKRNRKRYEQYLQRYERYFFKYWVRHPHPTMGYEWPTLAGWACDLREVLFRLHHSLAPRSDEIWSHHWRRGPDFKDARFQQFLDKADYARDPAMSTMGAAISFLDALYRCILSIGEEDLEIIERLPKVRLDHPRTPRRFFMDYMSDTMEKLYGPGGSQLFKNAVARNAVVADLTAVAFKLDEFGPESVRRRRRMRVAS